MKLISAIIKPSRVDDVRAALAAVGVHGMTVSEVRGVGRQGGRTGPDAPDGTVDLRPKLRLDIAVDEDALERAIEAVVQAARGGTIGDGKIFVVELEHGLRVRTGETGPAAL